MSCVYKSDHINILKSDFNTSMKENGIFPCPNHSCKLCIQPKHRLVLQIKHLMVTTSDHHQQTPSPTFHQK